MAGSVQEQEETKKSLGYYLHWVLAREASGKSHGKRSSSGHQTAETRWQAEELVIATALVKVVFYHLQTLEPAAIKYLRPLDDLPQEGWIHKTAPNQYQVRVWLQDPIPRGCFQVMSGAKFGLEPGIAKFGISASLTHEERLHTRGNWLPFVDEDDYLSSYKAHKWLSRVLDSGFRSLSQKTFRGRKLNVITSSEYPTLRVIVTCSAQSERDVSVNTFTLSFLPAVRVSGFPRGLTISHPFPRQMPFSLHGQLLLQQLQQDIEEGDVCFNLEVDQQSDDPKPDGGNSRPSTQPLTSRRAARMVQARAETDRKHHHQKWKMSLAQIEELLLERALQFGCMKHAKTASAAFRAINGRKGTTWRAITPALQDSAMLWTMKKTAHKNSNASDWFVAYLSQLQKYLSSKFCPHFFQMNVNCVESSDTEGLQRAAKDLTTILEDIADNPTNLLKHYLNKH